MTRSTVGTHVIEFDPKALGLDLPHFNTFRLGAAWSKRVRAGDAVLLLNKKDMVITARAKVFAVCTGPLSVMSRLHAQANHQFFDALDAPADLVAFMSRLYGPHKCTEESKVTVLYLQR